MSADYFALLHLDLECDDAARIRAAVAETRGRCSQGTMSGLDRVACEQLLARLPEIEAALLDPGARRQARDEARQLRAAARAARLSAFREDLAMLLAGGRASLTEPECEHLLRAHASPDGPTAAELTALIGVPVVAAATKAPAAARPLAPHEAREIARNLARLGYGDLYAFLDLPRSAAPGEISARRDELAASWARKAKATAEKSAAQALLGRVATVLLDPARRASYAATLRAARLEPLLPAIALALADGRISAHEHAHLLERAQGLGLGADEAEKAILAAAAAADADVEPPLAAAQPASTPAPPAAAPAPPPPAAKLIATFNASTGWAGMTITYEKGRFTLEGHGPLSAADLLSYDNRGYIDWAHAVLREWVGGLATGSAAGPAPAPRTASATPAGARIGEPYGGGIIAYILRGGDPGYVSGETHGLIAAAADQTPDSGIQWARKPYWRTAVPGARGTAFGSGAANTNAIIAQNGAGSDYAAGLARAYTGGGHSDWYLPSKDELYKLYVNSDAIGGFHTARGDRHLYWSSSQNADYASHAWVQFLCDGGQHNYTEDDTYRVRAVRAF